MALTMSVKRVLETRTGILALSALSNSNFPSKEFTIYPHAMMLFYPRTVHMYAQGTFCVRLENF